MIDEASPRPWRVSETLGHAYIVQDARGSVVAHTETCALSVRPRHRADAALIVDAVNAIDATKKLSIKLYDPIRRAEAERDRLRDIVRKFVDLFTPETIHPAGTMERLLREARAAIGAGENLLSLIHI